MYLFLYTYTYIYTHTPIDTQTTKSIISQPFVFNSFAIKQYEEEYSTKNIRKEISILKCV